MRADRISSGARLQSTTTEMCATENKDMGEMISHVPNDQDDIFRKMNKLLNETALSAICEENEA